MGQKKVEESVKCQAICLWKAGKSCRDIGNAQGIAKTCVEHLVHKVKVNGIIKHVPCSGCPRKTTPRKDHSIFKKSKKNWNASLSDLVADLTDCHKFQVSWSSVSPTFVWSGNDVMLCFTKAPFVNYHKRKSRIFCVDKRNWSTEQWRRDESCFELSPRQQVQVRWTSTEKFMPACIARRVSHDVGLHNKWRFRNFVEGSMNREKQIETLEDVMFPSVWGLLGTTSFSNRTTLHTTTHIWQRHGFKALEWLNSKSFGTWWQRNSVSAW